MPRQPSWKVDVKSLSPDQIVQLLKELRGSEHKEQVQNLKRELIERARGEGATDEQIIRVLAQNVARGSSLHDVAKEWADCFGISVTEFKRIADAR
jgi:hypothetical protein